MKNQLDPNLSFVILDDSTDDFNCLKIENLLKPASTEFFESEEKLEFDGNTQKFFTQNIILSYIVSDPMLYIYTSGTTGLPKWA